MDIVYIFKTGPKNSAELRYSLRSLKNIPHDKVHIIGDLPEWVGGVNHIKADDPYQLKALNALHKLKQVINCKAISDDFILMNDDFIIIDKVEPKNYHQGSILDHYNRRSHTSSKYVELLKKTLDMFPEGLDYSLHIPFVMNKKKLSEMIEKYDFSDGLLIRNIYGNLYIKDAEYMNDVKLTSRTGKNWSKYLSTSDDMVKNPQFMAFINDLFPDMSPYEIYPINYNLMKAIANYDITVDGVNYEKGKTYEIDPVINQSNPYGKDYFTPVSVDDVEVEKVEKKNPQKQKEPISPKTSKAKTSKVAKPKKVVAETTSQES